jgi:serine/threonine protein kinase/Flp pilus assembly protein TadD
LPDVGAQAAPCPACGSRSDAADSRAETIGPGGVSGPQDRTFFASLGTGGPELPRFPRRFGHFRLLRKIGQGGMGVVYEAEDVRLSRHVALKMMRSEDTTRDVRERFEREPRIAGPLDHPNVVPVYEAGDIDGVLFFAMPLVSGLSLAELIAFLHGHATVPAPEWLPLPEGPQQRCDLLLQWFDGALQGLQFAHARGIVHRDIKPENLIFDANTGLLRIADFGLARSAKLVQMTGDRTLLGTIAYMAPEQLRHGSADLDRRADVYSMGCTLYRALADHLPYAASADGGYIEKVLQVPPDPPRGVPGELAAILFKALAKSPDDRYQDAESLRRDLERYRRGQAPGLPAPTPAVQPAEQPPAPRPSPSRAALALAVVGLLIAAAFAARMIARWRAAPALSNPRAIVILPFDVEDAKAVDPAGLGRLFALAVSMNLSTMLPDPVKPVPARPAGGQSPDDVAARSDAGRWVAGALKREPEALAASLRIHDVREGFDRTRTLTTADPELGGLAYSLAKTVAKELGHEAPRQYAFIDALVGDPKMAANRLTSLALGAIHRHDVEGAVVLTDQLVAALPDEPDAEALRAYSLLASYQRGHSQQTLMALQQSLDSLEAKDPNGPYAELFRGSLDRYSGEPLKAIERISRVLQRSDLTPQARAWVLRTRGNIRTDLGRSAEAVKDLQESDSLDPVNSHTKADLSRALAQVGRFADALAPAQDAVALEPTADSFRTLSLALKRDGQMAKSLDAIRRACDMSGSQEHCSALALRLQQAGQEAEALKQAALASSLPPSPSGCYNLACLHALCGRKPDALRWLRRAYQEGYASVNIRSDPDLDTLRGNPEFESLVGSVMKRVSTPAR